jgi:hypothetical protein
MNRPALYGAGQAVSSRQGSLLRLLAVGVASPEHNRPRRFISVEPDTATAFVSSARATRNPSRRRRRIAPSLHGTPTLVRGGLDITFVFVEAPPGRGVARHRHLLDIERWKARGLGDSVAHNHGRLLGGLQGSTSGMAPTPSSARRPDLSHLLRQQPWRRGDGRRRASDRTLRMTGRCGRFPDVSTNSPDRSATSQKFAKGTRPSLRRGEPLSGSASARGRGSRRQGSLTRAVYSRSGWRPEPQA